MYKGKLLHLEPLESRTAADWLCANSLNCWLCISLGARAAIEFGGFLPWNTCFLCKSLTAHTYTLHLQPPQSDMLKIWSPQGLRMQQYPCPWIWKITWNYLFTLFGWACHTWRLFRCATAIKPQLRAHSHTLHSYTLKLIVVRINIIKYVSIYK